MHKFFTILQVNKSTPGAVYLKCTNKLCRGKAVAAEELRVTVQHNHGQEETKINNLIFKDHCIHRARNSNELIKNIYDEERARYEKLISLKKFSSAWEKKTL